MLSQLRIRARLARAFIALTLDPEQTDQVIELSDFIAAVERERRVAQLLALPEVGERLQEGLPEVRIDLGALSALPAGSLGQVFAAHQRAHGFSVEDLAYFTPADAYDAFRDHVSRTHDLWHVLTGFDVDPAGELGLQAFMIAQLHAPLGLLTIAAGLLNALLKAPQDSRRRMEAISVGWQMGQRARPLFGVDWAPLWALPLSEVRASLGLEPVSDPAAGGAALAA